jgi:hypothetical protein
MKPNALLIWRNFILAKSGCYRQSTTPLDYWSTFEEPVPLGTISSF